MVNRNTRQHKRGREKEDFKVFKQSTLDNLAYHFDIQKTKGKDKTKKKLIVNGIDHATKENELDLRVGFSLLPSKDAFSKINIDLYFQDSFLNSTTLSIPQSLLLTDSFEHSIVLDMTGIREGDYIIRVELYELWNTNEKLNYTSEELILHYTPVTREERLVKIPTVKSIAGTDLAILSSTAKEIYSEIDKDLKKESESRRDHW